MSTTVPRFQRYASIAMDAGGDFVIAWQNEHGDANLGSTSIDARRYSAAGVALTGEFRVNTTTLGNHRFPATAMDSDGDFLVAWAGYGQDPGDNQAAAGLAAADAMVRHVAGQRLRHHRPTRPSLAASPL